MANTAPPMPHIAPSVPDPSPIDSDRVVSVASVISDTASADCTVGADVARVRPLPVEEADGVTVAAVEGDGVDTRNGRDGGWVPFDCRPGERAGVGTVRENADVG